ncbi:DNA-binding GntR family transcriptional regulator [Rhodococcus sp. 27YEA15]|uniref:GntR family transcriptional regulator n=1 Tax=Rhodococcus sp. 27YEA15 TaxID=3156259 RepID=UPI003C7C84F2
MTQAPMDAEDRSHRRSAASRVSDWLRDGIISGRIAEGTFLDEVWVADSVGTSRTPVREAFHRLSAERFIDLLPRKGAQVHVVTARELDEVNSSRLLIESHAARSLCAESAGAPPEMHTLLDEMTAAEERRDWFDVVNLNWRFHRSMVRAHGNAVLAELYDTLRSRQQRVGLRALQSSPARVPLVNAQHRAIVDALDASDNDRLQVVLTEHLRTAPEIEAAFNSRSGMRG